MARLERGDLSYVINDHLGTPKEVVGTDGTLRWSADHDTWGTLRTRRRGAAQVEAGYYCRDGHYKRFFDEAALCKLLEGWERETLERRSLSTPSGTKHVFFAAVRKPKS